MIKIVVTYDIKDTKRLRTVSKFLETQGIRVQNSVFEIITYQNKITEFRDQLSSLIDKNTDSIIIYNLGDYNKTKIIRLKEDKLNSFYTIGYIII